MYHKIASGYNELHGKEQLEKLKIISKFIKVKETDRLLDIGCGTGISTNYFKCESCGVDNCEEMIKEGTGNLIVSSYEKLPFDDKYFDVILCITAVHHFTNLNKFIEEVKRVIKSNGIIVITILKKSPKADYIRQKLLSNFIFVNEINESKDIILIFKHI